MLVVALVIWSVVIGAAMVRDLRDVRKRKAERAEFIARMDASIARLDAAIDAQQAALEREPRMGVARWAWDADGREVET